MARQSAIATKTSEALVFKALSDPNRRALLDMLFQQDGQALSALESQFEMTRFGVMKHLKILEEANLITTQKQGRLKLHYLNPIPIQQVYDRWVSKYARGITSQMTKLKEELETKVSTITHRYQIYIHASAETVWQALTDGETSKEYYFGLAVASSWKPGEPYRYSRPDGSDLVVGEILEIDPPHTLVQTFEAHWNPDVEGMSTSKVTWNIKQVGDTTSLTVVHENLPDNEHAANIIDGWSRIMSGLKTYLETGQPLHLEIAQPETDN